MRRQNLCDSVSYCRIDTCANAKLALQNAKNVAVHLTLTLHHEASVTFSGIPPPLGWAEGGTPSMAGCCLQFTPNFFLTGHAEQRSVLNYVSPACQDEPLEECGAAFVTYIPERIC